MYINTGDMYYNWLPVFIMCNLYYTYRVFFLPIINIVVPLKIRQPRGETKHSSNSVECRYICHS